eukprot:1180617-Prorocentrum_minimum.AAC.5
MWCTDRPNTHYRPQEAGPPSCPARGLVPCRPPLPGSPSLLLAAGPRQQALAAERGSLGDTYTILQAPLLNPPVLSGPGTFSSDGSKQVLLLRP